MEGVNGGYVSYNKTYGSSLKKLQYFTTFNTLTLATFFFDYYQF